MPKRFRNTLALIVLLGAASWSGGLLGTSVSAAEVQSLCSFERCNFGYCDAATNDPTNCNDGRPGCEITDC